MNAKTVSSPKSRRIAGNWRGGEGRSYRFPRSPEGLALGGRGFLREGFLSPFPSSQARKRVTGNLSSAFLAGGDHDRNIPEIVNGLPNISKRPPNECLQL
ncbi:PREDICTED: uncharacterized protein LOC105447944 isoform X2 [Wasmannia auropunctata]|uniref:uncharacterized protein LOC105447944 isoform X2 n=1 Tax=Wasmannia auropunctata TaxID=64793 RepID=UPI0005EDD3FB|nr:PREDICTED: uncharacterized protein LOC105447944 isoform X2 [Wasmannia auropunctata]